MHTVTDWEIKNWETEKKVSDMTSSLSMALDGVTPLEKKLEEMNVRILNRNFGQNLC